MVNPCLMDYKSKNGVTLVTNFGKKKISGSCCLDLREKKVKTKNFLKPNRLDEPELSVQSEQVEPEQCR